MRPPARAQRHSPRSSRVEEVGAPRLPRLRPQAQRRCQGRLLRRRVQPPYRPRQLSRLLMLLSPRQLPVALGLVSLGQARFSHALRGLLPLLVGTLALTGTLRPQVPAHPLLPRAQAPRLHLLPPRLLLLPRVSLLAVWFRVSLTAPEGPSLQRAAPGDRRPLPPPLLPPHLQLLLPPLPHLRALGLAVA